MRDRLLPRSNRLPYEDWALETAVQVCGGLRTVYLHMKCSLRRTECGFLTRSLARCMVLPGNAVKIRRADWETVSPRYQRHGGGGKKWIPLERSASGSVYDDPRRAGRLCRTAKSTWGCVEDGFQPAAEYRQQIRKGPPVRHYCHNWDWKCLDVAS